MNLYIHIPFCTSKCGYCAFYSKASLLDSKNALYDAYVDALLKDLSLELEGVKSLESIFIGGGTPNTLHQSYYEKIFSFLESRLANNCEITTEANPELINPSWLSALKSFGVNRISLGIQSFFSDKLELLQRSHNIKDISSCFKQVSKYFDNINADLIYDCILDSKARLKEEILSALNLGITHLSAYSLSIEEGAIFGANKSYDALLDYKEELKESSSSYFMLIRDVLYENGFYQYEVSNYSKNDKFQCRHNLAYWQAKNYLACGASAVGRKDLIRYRAINHVDKYILNPSYKIKEYLTHQDLEFERLFLGLRSKIGIDLRYLKSSLKERINHLLKEDICYIDSNNHLVVRNLNISDEVVLYLS